jgi:hypothetical protein
MRLFLEAFLSLPLSIHPSIYLSISYIGGNGVEGMTHGGIGVDALMATHARTPQG